MIKGTLLAIGAMLYVASSALALDLIELNDVNKNKMTVGVIRSLKTIQDAIQVNFKFERLEDAELFVARCQYLRSEIKSVGPDAFEGLAGRISSILEDPEVSVRCDFDTDKFADYSLLSEEPNYLSQNYIKKLRALSLDIAKDEEVNRLLESVVASVGHRGGLMALDNAAKDTSLYFGELDSKSFFSSEYLKGCDISIIRPICQLVRGTKATVQALSSDLDEFAGFILASDDSKIESKSSASGVSSRQLKDNCNKMSKERHLHAIEAVLRFLSSGYLTESEINEKKQNDEDFAFYLELNNLCNLVD